MTDHRVPINPRRHMLKGAMPLGPGSYVSMASLTHSMNVYIFGDPHAALMDLRLSAQGSLSRRARFGKASGFPSKCRPMSAPRRTEKSATIRPGLKVAHLPVKGLMGCSGRWQRYYPGRSNDSDIWNGQTGCAGHTLKSNCMAYKGGVPRFGGMTVTDADMQPIDEDATDFFHFFPDHYKDQLVAGYSKAAASGGLRVYMPDFDKIRVRLTRAGDEPAVTPNTRKGLRSHSNLY